MRSSILFCLVAVVLCAATVPSAANVSISNATTTNMTCSGGLCSPTAADAVLNVQDLEAMLASGNATVTTTGSGVQAGNIHVNAPLTWSTGSTLALDAYRSIEVNAKASVAGAGGVSLTTNDGDWRGEFGCNDKGRVVFSKLTGALTINGMPYTLVNSVASLASAIAAKPSGSFALAQNYDAQKDGTYATPPIPTQFTGSFDGLGNTISNLSINDPTENASVGFFAQTWSGSRIGNIHLANETVQGGSGGSYNNSTEFVGGLVGYASGDWISHSDTSGSVSGGDYSSVGGLLGLNYAIVTSSGSAATVSAGVYGPVGGLIGLENSSEFISDSWATGNVTGSGLFVGGLVGYNSSRIMHSWASGQVSGTAEDSYIGGLVGGNYGGIQRSHASGAVSCGVYCGVGGLVGGMFPGSISQSYATGSVTATDAEGGGLVAYNEGGEILNSYASGAVTVSVADGVAGGFVGQNTNSSGYGSILASYATGSASGASGSTGGLIGIDSFTNSIKHGYWDMTSSGITDPSQGAGNLANDPGIKGLIDKKLKSGLPKGFNPKIWAEDPAINGGLPYLIKNPPAN